ncbi:MAG TPA: ABC transporter ATP-binding protein [Anaerolinea sp.]|nr:ABC transporter ATP-binding protein [Anaerolinea sp.]
MAPIVVAEGLTKTYGKGSTTVSALAEIHLVIERGEFVAVMGPSGCGKSTLLHLIGGLDRPTSGEILLDGQALSRMDEDALTRTRRQKIGFVFQFFNLIPVLGTLENAALPMVLDGVPRAQAWEAARQWLNLVGLGDRLQHRPNELSGGQQQRVAIARALAHEPLLILADEPTGNLDSKAGDEVVGLLRRIAGEWGRSVMMVTHDPRMAAYADRIVFLKDGRVVDQTQLGAGKPASPRRDSGRTGG